MKKGLTGAFLLLATACVVGAQEERTSTANNAAMDFRETSTSQVNLFSAEASGSAPGDAVAGNAAGEAVAAPSPAPAAPPAKLRYIWGERDDYRWQLGVGVEFFRFRSNVISASLVGTDTSLAYYTNSWFAVEGNILTGFAPTIYDREHVKIAGGSGGLRIGGRRARWEPWAHVLAGGIHLQPQTAFGSRNSLLVEAGGGVDLRLNSRLSARLQGGWDYTRFFGQTQNGFEGAAGVVFHF